MNLEEFIRTQIESVEELRALLLMYGDPQAEWGVMTAAGKLYIPPAILTVILERLTAKKLLTAAGNPPRYRFKPQTEELERLVRELAELDTQRPVTLINMIYSRLKDVEAFADAFRIKKQS